MKLMKLKSVLAFGLAVNFLAIGAADPEQNKVRVMNISGYEIDVQFRALGASGWIKGDEIIMKEGRTTTINNVTTLAVRFTYDRWGTRNISGEFTKIDVSDLQAYPDDILEVSVGSERDWFGNLELKITRDWQRIAEGAAVQDVPSPEGSIEEGWEKLDVNETGQGIYNNITGSGRNQYIVRLKSDPQNYLQEIATFLSYLFKLAVEKKQGFEEGTFLVEDPQGDIYTFLNEYPETYDRVASHLVEFFEAENQPEKIYTDPLLGKKAIHTRGIDTIGNVSFYNFAGQGMLAEGKRHLFFERVNGYTLIKPEKWETSFVGALPHGYEFVIAQARKTPALQPYFGTDEAKEFRKERIPGSVLKPYLEIIAALPDAQDLTLRAKAHGIHEMASKLQEIRQDQNIDESVRNKANLLFEVIQGDYDHLDVRFGREVVLTQEDLRTGSGVKR